MTNTNSTLWRALLVFSGLSLVLITLAGSLPAAKAADLSLTTMARFAESVYLIKKGKDVSKVTPQGFVLREKYDSGTGVYAILFEEPKAGRVVLSFAGTEFSDPSDLLADLGIAGKEIEQLLDYLVEDIIDDAGIPKKVCDAAKKTMRAVMGIKKNYKKSKGRDVLKKGAKPGKKLDRQVAAALGILDGLTKVKRTNGKLIRIDEVEVVGHSLGGFLAQVLATKRLLRRAVAFNPPGADRYLNGAKAPGYLTNHARKGDLVGRFGKHTGPLYVYKNAKFKWERVKRLYLAQNHGMRDFREDLDKGMAAKRMVED